MMLKPSPNVDYVEAFFQQYAYPCMYVDMIPFFGCAVADYSIVSYEVMDHVCTNFSHMLSD